MAELDGVRLKLRRARRHLDDLDVRVQAWNASDPYAFVQTFDGELNAHVLRSTVTKPFDAELALVAGEAVGQTREALDHLIQRLVMAAGRTPNRSHQFPICRDKQHSQPSKIRGIDPRWQQHIRSMQPFAFSSPSDHPLFVLNEVIQGSKHHDVLVTATTLQAPGPAFEFAVEWTPSESWGRTVQTIQSNFLGAPVEGALLQGIKLVPDDPGLELRFDGRFPIAVGFGPRRLSVEQLRELVETVARSIAQFEPAFGRR